jgi:transposase
MVNTKFEAQRQTILHYWLNGIHSPKEIHELTSISLRTINYNIKKNKETDGVEHRRGNGRKTKVTQSISRAIGQYVHRNTAISTRQLAAKIENTQDISISHVTVWQHMKKKGYQSSVPLGTPMLTERHIEMRMEWAQTHLNDNWGRVIFTDETAFDLFRNKVRRWHKNGERPIRRLPKSRQKVMAWGGISLKGKTPLFCFTNIMDGPFYVSILQNQLLPSARNMYRRNWILQQDNDPKHTSRVAKDFIAENRIHAIDWPSNSPDLNPIENVWQIMKNNVEKRMPKDINELTQFLAEEWDAIPQTIVNNLVLSMKTRCELILEKNGDRISY